MCQEFQILSTREEPANVGGSENGTPIFKLGGFILYTFIPETANHTPGQFARFQLPDTMRETALIAYDLSSREEQIKNRRGYQESLILLN